jgi:hypothetical protein
LEDSIYPSFLGHSTGIMFDIIVEIEYSIQGYFPQTKKQEELQERKSDRKITTGGMFKVFLSRKERYSDALT